MQDLMFLWLWCWRFWSCVVSWLIERIPVSQNNTVPLPSRVGRSLKIKALPSFKTLRYVRFPLHTVTCLMFMWPCIVIHFLQLKPTRCTNFSNLFWNETLHVSEQFLRPPSGVFHCTRRNGICHTRLLTVCKLSANLYDIYRCCVYSEKLLIMVRGTVQNM